jgi:hypothetical protein
MHLGKEAVDMNRLVIRRCKAKLMIADGSTKPLDGRNFNQFLNSLSIFDIIKRQPVSVE